MAVAPKSEFGFNLETLAGVVGCKLVAMAMNVTHVTEGAELWHCHILSFQSLGVTLKLFCQSTPRQLVAFLEESFIYRPR